jgi:hypothetical protein
MTEEQPEFKVTNTRQARIQKMLEDSKKFNEESKQRIKLAPNVKEVILFPADFYLDYDELLDEAILVKKMDPKEAAVYAEKNYKIRKKLEEDPEDSSRNYAQHTYRVKLPNSSFPDMVRELKVSSKKGIEAINNALASAAMNTDGELVMGITMKQGSNKFKVDWEVDCQPWSK